MRRTQGPAFLGLMEPPQTIHRDTQVVQGSHPPWQRVWPQGRIRASCPGRGAVKPGGGQAQTESEHPKQASACEIPRGSPQSRGRLEEGVTAKVGRTAADSIWSLA